MDGLPNARENAASGALGIGNGWSLARGYNGSLMGFILRSTAARLTPAVAAVLTVAVLTSQNAPRERVGPLPDGAFLLNSGWRLKPAGRQVPLDTFPMSSALSRDGKYLVVLNAGYKPPTLSVIDTATARVAGSAKVADGWLGLTFAPNSNRVYVGGGSEASVFEFTLNADGTLTPGRTFEVVPKARRADEDFVGDLAFSPDGRLLYAAQLYRNSIAVINPLSGIVIGHYATGRRPIACSSIPTANRSSFRTGPTGPSESTTQPPATGRTWFCIWSAPAGSQVGLLY